VVVSGALPGSLPTGLAVRGSRPRSLKDAGAKPAHLDEWLAPLAQRETQTHTELEAAWRRVSGAATRPRARAPQPARDRMTGALFAVLGRDAVKLVRLLALCCFCVGSLPCLASAAEAREDLEALVRALGSDDDVLRAPAIEELAKGGKKAGERLLAEFASQKVGKRTGTGVIEVLGKMKKTGEQLLEGLLLRPLDTGSIVSVTNALGAIGECGPRAAWTAPVLVELVERKPVKAYLDVYLLVKRSAILTLGLLGPTTPAAKVLKREVKSDELGTRIASARSLWWTGSAPEEVYPVLLEGLASKDVPTLESAIFGLGEMGPQAKDALARLASLNELASQETRITIDEARRKIEGFLAPIGPRPADKAK